jgi:hypothetical protein
MSEVARKVAALVLETEETFFFRYLSQIKVGRDLKFRFRQEILARLAFLGCLAVTCDKLR